MVISPFCAEPTEFDHARFHQHFDDCPPGVEQQVGAGALDDVVGDHLAQELIGPTLRTSYAMRSDIQFDFEVGGKLGSTTAPTGMEYQAELVLWPVWATISRR